MVKIHYFWGMKRIALLFTAALAAAAAFAAVPVRWHNEATDTLKIQQILGSVASRPADSLAITIARGMTGIPYEAATLEIAPEMTTVNLDGVDCTTFVEDVIALALTAREGRQTWRDFAYNLENLRYRGGKADGYSSRLHYISDWIMENSRRGNLREITDRLPGAEYKIKTLDFMSRHRDSYPALADDAEFQRLKSIEGAYRSHRYPMVASTRLSKQALAMLKPGDIVAFVSKIDGLDVAHLGFVDIVGGQVRLLHASSHGGKVMVDPLPLVDYLKRNRRFTGIRVFRLAD